MVTSIMVYAALGLAMAVSVLWFARRLSRRWLAWSCGVTGGFLGAAAAVVLAWSIAAASGDRSARSISFEAGVTYERIAVDEPRRQVFHVVVADLDNPCLALVTTRPKAGGETVAETGTEFVSRTNTTVSINAAFFYPFDEFPFWSSYPHSGDVVTAIGPVVINSEWLGDVNNGGDLGLALTDGRLSASQIPADADFGVRGRIALVAAGRAVAPDSPSYARSVVGVDLDTNELVMLVSDGKQPGYAEGSTYEALAAFLIARGVDEAVEFDGGGSATMAAMVDGNVELLSRPSHQRLPGRQRPVASHVGLTIDPACD